MSAVLTIARRELAACFHAPIAWVVGVAFLVAQGFSFWAVVRVLADPRQPAPLGAVLEQHFGGTLLHWSVVLLVVSVLSMRAIADERRSGTWETLMTSPVGEAAAVVGKWLGATAFYALLWLPTAAYLIVLERYAPPGMGFELGPVLAAYLGVVATGAAFLALGMAASAATSNQIVAAVVTFVGLLALVVGGSIGDAAPGALAGAPRLAAALAALDVRGHLQACARGELGAVALWCWAALTVVGLSLAIAVTTIGRRRRSEIGARMIATALVAVIAGLAGVLVARHPLVWDVTARRVNSLDSRSREVLAGLAAPVELVMVRPTAPAFEPAYAQVERLVDRLIAAQPALTRRGLDPALEPARAAEVARELAISLDDLGRGGAVVVAQGARRRAVALIDMVGFGRDALAAGTITELRAEAALAAAIAEVSGEELTTLCFTSGHGELAATAEVGASRADTDWYGLGARLIRDGYRLSSTADVAGGVPARCGALLLAGPTRPRSPAEAAAIADYLDGGGAVLLAASSSGEAQGEGALPQTGLEVVLAAWGVSLPRAVVDDPASRVELPDAWLTVLGYGAHPISQAFQGRRFTVWQRPRALIIADAGARRPAVLVATSSEGRALAVSSDSPDNSAGVAAGAPLPLPAPIAIAAAVEDPGAGGRLVVLGSAESLSTQLVSRGAAGNERFAQSALAWLTGRARAIDVGDKRPEALRLVMTTWQLRQTFLACVVLLPLLLAGLGLVAWRWRRRAA